MEQLSIQIYSLSQESRAGRPTAAHPNGAQPGRAGIYEPIEKIHSPFTGKVGTCIILILFPASFT